MSKFEEEVERLIVATCKEMDVTREDVFSRCRKEELANARYFIAHIIKNRITRGDFPIADREVSKVINRDRSTCDYAYRRVEELMDIKSFWIDKYYAILKAMGYDTKEQPKLTKGHRTIDYLRGFIHYNKKGQISPTRTTNNIIKEIKLLKNEAGTTDSGEVAVSERGAIPLEREAAMGERKEKLSLN